MIFPNFLLIFFVFIVIVNTIYLDKLQSILHFFHHQLYHYYMIAFLYSSYLSIKLYTQICKLYSYKFVKIIVFLAYVSSIPFRYWKTNMRNVHAWSPYLGDLDFRSAAAYTQMVHRQNDLTRSSTLLQS